MRALTCQSKILRAFQSTLLYQRIDQLNAVFVRVNSTRALMQENISKGCFSVFGGVTDKFPSREDNLTKIDSRFSSRNHSLSAVKLVDGEYSFRLEDHLFLMVGAPTRWRRGRDVCSILFFSFSSRLLFYLFDLLFPLREREIRGSISYAVARSRRSWRRRRAFDRLRDGWRSDREPNFGNCFQELGQG